MLGVYTARTLRSRRQWGFSSVLSLGAFRLWSSAEPRHVLKANQIQFSSVWFQPISLCYIPWDQASASYTGKNGRAASRHSCRGSEVIAIAYLHMGHIDSGWYPILESGNMLCEMRTALYGVAPTLTVLHLAVEQQRLHAG